MKNTRTFNQDGFTLVELVVGMFILGLITLLFMNLYLATNKTSESVQKSSLNIATAQNVATAINSDLRNARHLQISPDGNQLDLELSNGACVSWKYENGTLSERNDVELGDDWVERITDATQDESEAVFTEGIRKSVSYSLFFGNAENASELHGTIYPRALSLEDDDSVCF